MKNVTITLEEPVADWARVRAAREGTSVSRLLGRMLGQMMRGESSYDAARERFLARRPIKLRDHPADKLPTREEVHERPGLR
jgi:hypothetical protein